MLNVMPNGVIRMSDVVPGVVETSLNVGVVKMSDDRVQIICLVRSLIESGKSSVVSMLTSLAALSGADIVAEGGYPLAAGCRLSGHASGQRNLSAAV